MTLIAAIITVIVYVVIMIFQKIVSSLCIELQARAVSIKAK